MNDPTPIGLKSSYIQLCRQHRQELRMLFRPAPWDWLLGKAGISRAGGSTPILSENEIVIPRLDQLVRRLREHAEVVVIDCLPQDFACLAFDEDGCTLANVVAGDAEEAALRALLLLAARPAAQQTRS